MDSNRVDIRGSIEINTDANIQDGDLLITMSISITTEEELASYLKGKSIAFKKITMLSGGNANFTFTVEDLEGNLTVMKHAEAYLKVQPSWHLGTSRMDSEARALETLASILPHSGITQEGDHVVRIPIIYSYDSDAHVIHESYAGPLTLKAAYSEVPDINVQAWGREIAHWVANLHLLTNSTELGDVSWATNIYRHMYNGLAGVLEKYGLDHELGVRINEKYGSLLAIEDQNVCHGDFWCGNMILSQDGKIMTIGDWEMVRRGNGATDIGQFSAEAYLLDRFRGGKDMLNPFLRAYKEKVKIDRDFAIRVAVHCATHLIYWPSSVHWVEKDETIKLAKEACDVLVMVEKQDWQGLRNTFIGEVFVDV